MRRASKHNSQSWSTPEKSGPLGPLHLPPPNQNTGSIASSVLYCAMCTLANADYVGSPALSFPKQLGGLCARLTPQRGERHSPDHGYQCRGCRMHIRPSQPFRRSMGSPFFLVLVTLPCSGCLLLTLNTVTIFRPSNVPRPSRVCILLFPFQCGASFKLRLTSSIFIPFDQPPKSHSTT